MAVSILFDIGVWLNVKKLKMFDEEVAVDGNSADARGKTAFGNGVEAKSGPLTCGKDTMATEAILSHRREHRGSIDL